MSSSGSRVLVLACDACSAERCAMPTTDGGIDFGGGGGGCVAGHAGRADTMAFFALLFFAHVALRRRR